MKFVHHADGRRIRTLHHQHVNRAPAVDQGVPGRDVGAVGDRRHVLEEHRRRAEFQRNLAEFFDRFLADHGVRVHQQHPVVDADVPRRADDVAVGERLGDLIERQVPRAELVGVDADDDGPLVAPERRRRRNARHVREHRPHPHRGDVLDLLDAQLVRVQYQVADRRAAGVEPGDERRHRPRRHHEAGAVHVGDGFGHRLGHVRAGVEVELDEGHALDVLRLDVLDAVDVEEVVLVVGREQTFHLGGVHAAVGLADVNHRLIQRREDIHFLAVTRQTGTDEQGDHRHEDGVRPAESEDDGVHAPSLREFARRTTGKFDGVQQMVLERVPTAPRRLPRRRGWPGRAGSRRPNT